MAFPTSPTNGQQANINGITYTYSSAATAWTVSTSVSNTFVSINVSDNVNSGNVLATGVISATGNVSGSNLVVTGNIIDTGALTIVTGSNGNITLSPNGTGIVAATGAISTTGNISANNATFTSNQTLSYGTANGVIYLNSNKVATSGIALTFDGSKLDVLRSSITTNAFDESEIRAINTGAATINQRVDIAMRFQDGTYNGTGGISMVRESATARSGALSFSSINSSGDATNAMRLDSSGNLGVGDTSPPAPGGADAKVISLKSTLYPQFIYTATGASPDGRVYRTITRNSGVFQIQTLNDIFTSEQTAYEILRNPGLITIDYHRWFSGSSEAMRLDSSGNFGLGVTPTSIQTGYKAIQIGATVGGGIVSAGTDTYFTNNLYVTGSQWYTGATGYGNFYNQTAGVHAFGTTTTAGAAGAKTLLTQLTLNANGALALLGASTSATGVGITFPATQSASTDANTLDDYEEGTWTPTIAGQSGGACAMTSGVSGVYTKIGNVVYCTCNIITWSSKTTLIGNVILSGLPFPFRNAQRFAGAFGTSPGGSLSFTGQPVFGADGGVSYAWFIVRDGTNNTYFHMQDANIASSGTIYGVTITYVV